jgi:hypothetical protein
MIDGLLLAMGVDRMWYAIPLIVAVSLVYSATRHEWMGPILEHAVRFAIWIVGFMAIVLLVFIVLSFFI